MRCSVLCRMRLLCEVCMPSVCSSCQGRERRQTAVAAAPVIIKVARRLMQPSWQNLMMASSTLPGLTGWPAHAAGTAAQLAGTWQHSFLLASACIFTMCAGTHVAGPQSATAGLMGWRMSPAQRRSQRACGSTPCRWASAVLMR